MSEQLPVYQWMTYNSDAGIPGVPVEVKGEHVFIPGDEHPYPFNQLQQNGNAKLTPLVVMAPERIEALETILDMAIGDAGEGWASAIVQEMLMELKGATE